jgi:glutathione S-transferase
MKLIGMLDSPFVRRVAISLQLRDLPFEHCNWSVGRDFDRIRAYSPLGRVPALVLDDGEVLTESSALLDYLDDLVGPGRALLPPTGLPRREALRLMAHAIGAAEKGRDQVYERAMRPAEKVHAPWAARLEAQMHGALSVLEGVATQRGDRWLVGDRLSQADITVACVATFLGDTVLPDLAARYPQVGAFTARCELLVPFAATRTPFFMPGRG